MKRMIDFGIDLGTTNSLIAKFESGQVEVFKNPRGFQETLPSMVGFRNERILVGGAARSYVEKDPSRVASRFKRKMGTTETLRLQDMGSKTPVELSTLVLNELKGFVRGDESVEAAVITIPASFDTVQSNATKQAGLAAGFSQVLLLQEPIAASLAFANGTQRDLRNSTWMVYDLGGGTFDVALVRIVEGELTVVDHEGDNFLGGSDFDQMIVEHLMVPALERKGRFEDLLPQMKSARGTRNSLWYRLLYMAEEAKKDLSSSTAAEVFDIAVEDDDGTPVEFDLTITRTDFEALIRDTIDRTADMMKAILTRHTLRPSDLEFVLMVGGSTYIPYVRQRIGELMGTAVNTSIDPTNAIAVGAAYYAGTKELQRVEPDSTVEPLRTRVRTVYNRNSQESEETLMAKVDGSVEGLTYRITRSDGAFDSGTKAVRERIIEDLPLRDTAYNLFEFRVIGPRGRTVYDENIQIAQGRYSVAGQPLPEDISLVMDDPDKRDTKLMPIFARNDVLPTKGRKSVEVAKTILKGSDDEARVIVVEGPKDNHSSANGIIGNLIIKGTQVSRDLIHGMEMELTFEMSESRDLTIRVYIDATGDEFSDVFRRRQREVKANILKGEIWNLEQKIEEEIEQAENAGNAESVAGLKGMRHDVGKLICECEKMADDDETDDRFKLENRKRIFAQRVWDLTSSKRVDAARSRYEAVKKEVELLVTNNATDAEKQQYREVVAREPVFLQSSNSTRIDAAVAEFERLRWYILSRHPKFLVEMFNWLEQRSPAMNDAGLAKQLFEAGRRSIESRAWDELRDVNVRLSSLLPSQGREAAERWGFTNIV